MTHPEQAGGLSQSGTALAETQSDLAPERAQFGERWWSVLSPANASALYVLAAIIVVFAIAAPNTFPTLDTAKQILNTYSVTALAAMALILPLSAGVFDISIPYNMTLSGIVTTYIIVNTGSPVFVAVLGGLATGLLIGAVNSVIVVGIGIDSLIATLATGAVILAMSTLLTNSTAIVGPELAGGFSRIAQQDVGGVTIPVLYMLVVGVGLWYVQEYTASGRRLFAVGFNPNAARLAGVRVARLQTISLLTSGMIGSFAGIVLSSSIASGVPNAGNPYLLPAFAGVFLGATQFRHGRFNAPGTLLAILMIGTGVTGLQLANAEAWTGDLFTGCVLIAALAITKRQQKFDALVKPRRRLRRSTRAAADSVKGLAAG